MRMEKLIGFSFVRIPFLQFLKAEVSYFYPNLNLKDMITAILKFVSVVLTHIF